jgi:hypothetical protein
MSQSDRNDFTRKIGALCNGAMRFMKCPVELSTLVDAHNRLVPQELYDAMDTVKRYGVGMYGSHHSKWEYLFELGNDRAMWLRVFTPESNGLYTLPVPVTAKWKVATLGKDVICGRDVGKHRVVPLEIYKPGMTEEQFQSLIDWGEQIVELEREVAQVMFTFDEILKMASTIGQLKRMVPEIVNYAPKNLREALLDQKAQSALPGEWGPYDKTRVVYMLQSLAKFHLLYSINPEEREERGSPGLDRDTYTWCHTLQLQRPPGAS